jgi:hypothetical protein
VQEDILVVGNGPLGMSLAYRACELGHQVTWVITTSDTEKPAAINNLGIATSGFRFIPLLGNDEEAMEKLVKLFKRKGRKFLENVLGYNLIHHSPNKMSLIGISFDRHLKIIDRIIDNLGLSPQEFGTVEETTAQGILGPNLKFPKRKFIISDEMPFSQYLYFERIKDVLSLPRNRNRLVIQRVESIDEMSIPLDKDRKTKCKVRIAGQSLKDYDKIFFAPGRFVRKIIDDLQLGEKIHPVTFQLISAILPNDDSFSGSVFFDFRSHFSLVRHQPIAKSSDGQVLALNLGLKYEEIPSDDFDRLRESNLSDEERNSHLKSIWELYEYPCSDNEIALRKCHIVDFKKNPEDVKSKLHYEPFIFCNPDMPNLFIASCFRATLAESTADTLISLSGLRKVSKKKLILPANLTSDARSDGQELLVNVSEELKFSENTTFIEEQ